MNPTMLWWIIVCAGAVMLYRPFQAFWRRWDKTPESQREIVGPILVAMLLGLGGASLWVTQVVMQRVWDRWHTIPAATPSNLRVYTPPKVLVFEALKSLETDGLDLLTASRSTPSSDYEQQIVEWGRTIIEEMAKAGLQSEMLLINSDVGLPDVVPDWVPKENKRLYHNVWFRVYRLDQLLPKLEAEINATP